jgi:hypothetical protein
MTPRLEHARIPADDVGTGEAGDPFEGRIDFENSSGGIGHGDALAGACEDHLRESPLLIDLHAIGQVGVGARQAYRLTRRIAGDEGTREDRHVAPILVPQAELRLAEFGAAGDRRRQHLVHCRRSSGCARRRHRPASAGSSSGS